MELELIWEAAVEVEEGDFGSGLRRRVAEEKGESKRSVRKRKKRETPLEGESMAV